MKAIGKYEERARTITSLVCVGLDSDFGRLPSEFRAEANPQFAFNKWVIDQTYVYASAYKPNITFYLARGDEGLRELKLTMDYLKENYPDILTICDAKFADIGAGNDAYAGFVFDWLGFDAVTLNPYLGHESLQPFLDRDDKGCIILCRTSHPGADEIEDLQIRKRRQPLWHIIAQQVRDTWNVNQNCMLIVGAAEPDALREVRNVVGEMTILVSGVGAEGGDVEQVVRAGLNNDGLGLIINSSRGVIFAPSPADVARELRDSINMYY